jgi:hypothetical protein
MGSGIPARALALALALPLSLGPDREARAASDAASASDEAAALVDRAFKNLYADDYVQMLWLRTRTRGGREMARRLQITRKQSERPGRALVRFLEPYAVRRTAILVLERDGASDDQYVYLPAAERTMHLSASQRADSFFGTDLAYEDLEPKYAGDYAVTSLGDQTFEGIPCAHLELRPRPEFESSYERMETCIEPARAIMLWTDFYNRGKPWKRLEIDPTEVRPVKERFIPFRMTMSMPRRQSETVIETESYELRPEIPETIFSVFNLESGDAKRDRSRSGGEAPLAVPDVAAGPED